MILLDDKGTTYQISSPRELSFHSDKACCGFIIEWLWQLYDKETVSFIFLKWELGREYIDRIEEKMELTYQRKG